MSRLDYKGFYRRNLPHWQPAGATLFVTSCLSGTLPQSTLDWYEREKKRVVAQAASLRISESTKLKLELERRWFARIERALDKAESGPAWLKDERVAQMLADNLHFHDGKKYRLDAYCIMPNHAHLVFAPLQITDGDWSSPSKLEDGKRAQAGSLLYVGLASIMHSFKSYTSGKANRLLNRDGEFWQHESYDRSIRDEDEWLRVIAYVLNNPVKARLVTNWQDWPFTYVRNQT